MSENEELIDLPGPTTLENWVRTMTSPAPSAGGRLPSHSPTCAGCGPENPAGLALQVDATETGVRCVHRFDRRQEGAPGIAHGGLVATAFDDLFGFLLYRVGRLAVTRSITVEYLRPVLLHTEYEFSARVLHQTGRRLDLAAEATDDSGADIATARAAFVVVDLRHFQESQRTAGSAP